MALTVATAGAVLVHTPPLTVSVSGTLAPVHIVDEAGAIGEGPGVTVTTNMA